MALNTQSFLSDELADADLPQGLAFAYPEDALSPQDEEALRVFLQAFEDEDDDHSISSLFLVEGLER